MFFKAINKGKYLRILKSCVHALIFVIILTINGCTTSKETEVASEKLPYQEDYIILKVLMKDGIKMNFKGMPAKYFKEYDSLKNVIVYNKTLYDKQDTSIGTFKKGIIKLSDAKTVTIEKEKFNTLLAVVILGTVAVLGVILFLTAPSEV